MTKAVERDLKPYSDLALKAGATEVVQVEPASVVTGAWVRMKCLFGCQSHCWACPPNSPTPDETRKVLDSYQRGLLFRFEVKRLEPDTPDSYRKLYSGQHKMVVDLEATLFKDGYYKAFSYLFGGCVICPECSITQNLPCRFRQRMRPPMEASGIDVFQTVRNNGLKIETLHVRGETRNQYALLMVD